MNTAEKLRFIADRIEDGKEFLLFGSTYKFINGELSHLNYDEKSWRKSCYRIQTILDSSEKDLDLKPQWYFTEDEKSILRNLPDYCKWIARDKKGWLQLFQEKPQKRNSIWYKPNWTSFSLFDKSFQSIQWEDDEPCEFRRYL